MYRNGFIGVNFIAGHRVQSSHRTVQADRIRFTKRKHAISRSDEFLSLIVKVCRGKVDTPRRVPIKFGAFGKTKGDIIVKFDRVESWRDGRVVSVGLNFLKASAQPRYYRGVRSESSRTVCGAASAYRLRVDTIDRYGPREFPIPCRTIRRVRFSSGH